MNSHYTAIDGLKLGKKLELEDSHLDFYMGSCPNLNEEPRFSPLLRRLEEKDVMISRLSSMEFVAVVDAHNFKAKSEESEQKLANKSTKSKSRKFFENLKKRFSKGTNKKNSDGLETIQNSTTKLVNGVYVTDV